MGWKEVKRRMNVPILTPDGISAMVDSCLKQNGKNNNHSRTIIMDGYKSPVDEEESVSEVEIENIKFDIIRHMAKSLLKDCEISDSSKNVSQFFSGWEEHNKGLGLDITVGELQEIASMSNDNIRSLIEEKPTNGIGNFIYKIYATSCRIGDEHNGATPIYPFEKTHYTEKNTLWGYNKRMYLNPSLNNINTYKFLAEYIKKCIDRRIPFDMKGFGSDTHSEQEIDGMILYSNNKYFSQNLECLEEVIKENPEIMSTFGTPIYTGAMINDETGKPYYTIGSGFPCTYRNCTYNDYIDATINLTYLTSSAKLIKQYLGVVFDEYKNLDEDTKLLINKLSNLDNCSAEELQKIEVGRDSQLKEQKDTIRELSHKIIMNKEEKGTEQDKQEVRERLEGNFSNNFRAICSVLKFNDKTHINTPVYKDESFLDFERQIRSRDIAEADKVSSLSTSEVYEAKKLIGKMVEKDDKKQEI